MNWGEYKARCDQPDYWSAWMTNQCIQLLEGSDLCRRSRRVVGIAPGSSPASAIASWRPQGY
jgi:hypothetical protein